MYSGGCSYVVYRSKSKVDHNLWSVYPQSGGVEGLLQTRLPSTFNKHGDTKQTVKTATTTKMRKLQFLKQKIS